MHGYLLKNRGCPHIGHDFIRSQHAGLIDEIIPYTPQSFSAANKKRTVSVRATMAELNKFKPEQLQNQVAMTSNQRLKTCT